MTDTAELLEKFAKNADRYEVGAPETADEFQVYVSLGDCRKARALLRSGTVAQAWRDISTAPKDGTEIIGLFFRQWDAESKPTTYGPWTVAWDGRKWRSSWDGSEVISSESDFGTEYKEPDIDPTHWQPLPDASSLTSTEGK